VAYSSGGYKKTAGAAAAYLFSISGGNSARKLARRNSATLNNQVLTAIGFNENGRNVEKWTT
jgi:hypothetical protein